MAAWRGDDESIRGADCGQAPPRQGFVVPCHRIKWGSVWSEVSPSNSELMLLGGNSTTGGCYGT